jgi:hypothetical protein
MVHLCSKKTLGAAFTLYALLRLEQDRFRRSLIAVPSTPAA